MNTTTITTTKPLIPNKLGWARNETQSKIIEIRDLKYKKSMIVIVPDSDDDENNDNDDDDNNDYDVDMII
jgi:hypothetical protein